MHLIICEMTPELYWLFAFAFINPWAEFWKQIIQIKCLPDLLIIFCILIIELFMLMQYF